MTKPVFIVAGGDLRQLYTAEAMAAYGEVWLLGFDTRVTIPPTVKLLPTTGQEMQCADYLILPMLCSEDDIHLHAPFCRQRIPLASLPALLQPGGMLLSGHMGERTRALFASQGIAPVDYAAREELAVWNAVPTAEGALQIAMEELPTTIYGTKVLVTGYGRIAKVLVRLLTAMGALVTVTARRYSDLAWAQLMGCQAVELGSLAKVLPEMELIYNTVPAVLLDEACLQQLLPDTLIIDLASKPGGAVCAQG